MTLDPDLKKYLERLSLRGGEQGLIAQTALQK